VKKGDRPRAILMGAQQGLNLCLSHDDLAPRRIRRAGSGVSLANTANGSALALVPCVPLWSVAAAL
jgi:hypothetical protein